MKKIIFLFLTVGFPFWLYSQQLIHPQIPITTEDVKVLNRKMIKLLKKRKIKYDKEDLNFHHVFLLGGDVKLTRNELVNIKLKYKITDKYYYSSKKKKSYVRTSQSIVTNKKNNQIIAEGLSETLLPISSGIIEKRNYNLLKEMFARNYSIFFTIYNMDTIFGITEENEMFAIIEVGIDNYNTITIKEFIDKYYDKWIKNNFIPSYSD